MDGVWILAVMTFPNADQEDARDALYAIKVAEAEIEASREGDVTLRADLARRLIEGPNKSQIRKRIEQATREGTVAGDLLGNLYGMCSFPDHFPEPSVRKAIFAARHFARRTTYGDGSRLPHSDRGIRDYFEHYRPVAHLWAAFRLHQAFPIRNHRDVLASPDAVQDFLAIARRIQEFGCKFFSGRDRTKKPLLDARTMWRVPQGDRVLAPPWKGPPDWLLAAMKQYKATT
jgi:hypothetical protein